MGKNKKYPVILFVVFFLISACEKNVDIDIEEIDPMIVLNGVLKADSTVEIYLSRTRHILDNRDITNISDASVEISDDAGNNALLKYGSDKLYETVNMQVIPGRSYTVTAAAPGFNDVSATCVIPDPVPFQRFDTAGTVNEWGDKMMEFDLVFNDPPGENNYYRLSFDARIAVKYQDIVEVYDTLYYDPVKDTAVMGYRVDTIEYVIPQVQGVWFESEDLAIEQWDYNSNAVIFTDKLFDGKEYSFHGTFYTYFLYGAGDTSTVFINFESIDEDYYLYLDSREKHYYAKNDPFAVPVVVHSNVENGVGILGGVSVWRDSIHMAPLYNNWEYIRID